MVPQPAQRTPASAILRELALSPGSLSAAQLAGLLDPALRPPVADLRAFPRKHDNTVFQQVRPGGFRARISLPAASLNRAPASLPALNQRSARRGRRPRTGTVPPARPPQRPLARLEVRSANRSRSRATSGGQDAHAAGPRTAASCPCSPPPPPLPGPAGDRLRIGPAARHSCAAWRQNCSFSSPSEAPSRIPATSASRSARPAASSRSAATAAPCSAAVSSRHRACASPCRAVPPR